MPASQICVQMKVIYWHLKTNSVNHWIMAKLIINIFQIPNLHLEKSGKVKVSEVHLQIRWACHLKTICFLHARGYSWRQMSGSGVADEASESICCWRRWLQKITPIFGVEHHWASKKIIEDAMHFRGWDENNHIWFPPKMNGLDDYRNYHRTSINHHPSWTTMNPISFSSWDNQMMR